MDNSKFSPINDVESKLVEARQGKLSLFELIKFLLNEKLIIVSLKPVKQDSTGFDPLLFDRDGIPMASVFTHRKRLLNYKDRIKAEITLSFKDILKRIPDGYGIVVNPGYSEGLEIQPHGITNIRKDFLLADE